MFFFFVLAIFSFFCYIQFLCHSPLRLQICCRHQFIWLILFDKEFYCLCIFKLLCWFYFDMQTNFSFVQLAFEECSVLWRAINNCKVYTKCIQFRIWISINSSYHVASSEAYMSSTKTFVDYEFDYGFPNIKMMPNYL